MSLVVPTLLALKHLPTLEEVPLIEVNIETLKSTLNLLITERRTLSKAIEMMLACRAKFLNWDCRTVEQLRRCVERDPYFRTLDMGDPHDLPTERYLKVFNMCLREPIQEPCAAFDEEFFESLQVCMTVLSDNVSAAHFRCSALTDDSEALARIIDLLEVKAPRGEFVAEMKAFGINIGCEFIKNV